MKWKGRRQSTNVEDRRGQRLSGGTRRAGGGNMAGILLSLFARANAKTKLLLIVVGLIGAAVFQVNPLSILGLSSGQSGHTLTQVAPAPDDEMKAFLSTMKADNEDVWTRLFQQRGRRYESAKLVIYSDQTPMPGGVADARMGPFYMPANQTVYIDPNFFNEMSSRFGAPGDFAQAYVVAHEVGHHVQHLLGYTDLVHGKHGKIPEKEYNRLSVRLELQADFLAGVFAHHAEKQWQFLEEGDIQEAMNCAEAIGDDALMKQAGRRVVPDSFTHGTSEQRLRWFMKGFRSGKLEDGDTFEIPYENL